eukprot:COSAG06_NODE_13787_length_1219_cov_1.430357_1_plen_37_part_10
MMLSTVHRHKKQSTLVPHHTSATRLADDTGKAFCPVS